MHRSVIASIVAAGLLAVGVVSGAETPPLFPPLRDVQELPLPAVDPGLPSPSDFLGGPLGATFTPHHRIVAYLERLAAASPRVEIIRYGTSYEGRPLLVAAISSADTIARLDEVRDERRVIGDPLAVSPERRARARRDAPAVVWLGYGIHGNESSSAEAALGVAYLLAGGEGDGAVPLDDVVVLVDPLLNPDGRVRYVSRFLSRTGTEPSPLAASAEHVEPWPGARGNHYWIDLNRDWAWATQAETRARLVPFAEWEPQVAVDFHEMNRESTYFFPPPAEPVHPTIPEEAHRWLDVFGTANAVAFDRLGWTYYVGEHYDLFYPSYGDSYPSLRGAIGMTYEMAGGGSAGRIVELPSGERLSLADRVARHVVTSLATVRTSAAHARELVSHTMDVRIEGDPRTRAFLWSPEASEAHALAEVLGRHGIRVRSLGRSLELAVRPVAGGRRTTRTFPPETFAVSTDQPLGRLAAALLEREAEMPEDYVAVQRRRIEANLAPEFYDVTAWSLPIAFGIEAWRHDGPLTGLSEPPAEPRGGIETRGGVGYLGRTSGLDGYRFAAALQKAGIDHRVSLEGFRIGGEDLPAGSVFIPRLGLDEDALDDLARRLGVSLTPAPSSMTESGPSLGSDRMVPIVSTRIALLTGPGASPASAGALWHLLDVLVDAPHAIVDLLGFDRVDLDDFDVVILPDGSYEETLGGPWGDRLEAWIDDGGVLVAIGDGIDWVLDREIVVLEAVGEDGETEDGDPDHRLDADRFSLPGTAVAGRSPIHPLTVGLGPETIALFRGSRFFRPTGDPRRDLLTVADSDPIVAGFAWPESRDLVAGSALVVSQRIGSGGVVLFMVDPAYRLFWRGTMPLVLNPVLWGPSFLTSDAW